jgi:hypothetical protein
MVVIFIVWEWLSDNLSNLSPDIGVGSVWAYKAIYAKK